jgi:hypothetical protein
LAVALNVTVLETTAPAVGAVKLAVGAVVSGAGWTVTVTSSEAETAKTVAVSRST